MGKFDDQVRLRELACEFWALHADDALDDRMYVSGDYTQMFSLEFKGRWTAEAKRQGLSMQEMFAVVMRFRDSAEWGCRTIPPTG
jgi:hypothetical protein